MIGIAPVSNNPFDWLPALRLRHGQCPVFLVRGNVSTCSSSVSNKLTHSVVQLLSGALEKGFHQLNRAGIDPADDHLVYFSRNLPESARTVLFNREKSSEKTVS